MQNMYDADQNAKDITDHTSFHCIMKKMFSNVKLLYKTMNLKEKSIMKACNLFHKKISSMTHVDIKQVFEITIFILNDYSFN